MAIFRHVVALLALFAAAIGVPSVATAAPSYMSLSVHAASSEPAPGRTVMLALKMTPKPGWHGYWSNPGDSGLPPTVKWDLPAGYSVGALQHPAPKLFKVTGITSYVHGGTHVLLAPLKVPASAKPGDALPIRGKVDLLVCSDTLCVPQSSSVSLDLKVGSGAAATSEQALFAAARRALPASLPSAGEVRRDGNRVALTLPGDARLNAAKVNFFPAGEGVFERSETTSTDSGRLEILGTLTGARGSLSGLVTDGNRSYRVRFERTAGSVGAGTSYAATVASAEAIPVTTSAASPPAELEQVQPAPTMAAAQGADQPLLWVIVGALLGGVILNLMPCVFPILSLKALHLARSGHSETVARSEALAFSAGAVAACLALGAVLLLLRAMGVAAGWSFQLQNPFVILALLILVTGIALNLAGLFNVTGPSIEGKGERAGLGGSFGTGALAAFVATPCSAPFMASALGAALLLPVVPALLVFATLGLGLAIPFLLLGFIPALRSKLPKPGAWMVKFQRILSIPMFATALGLAWILGRQAGVDGMAAGMAAALIISLSLWWVGARQRGGRGKSWLPLLPASLLALGTAAAIPAPASAPVEAAVKQASVEPFSEARLAELRAQKVPVFVDFTADWCLSCKVNDKIAIGRTETQAAFARSGVITLVGDWTSGNPAITRFLAAHERNSIPFYLYYAPGREAEVMPQILTVGTLVSMVEGGNPRAS